MCQNCRKEKARNMFAKGKQVCERCYYKLTRKTDKIDSMKWSIGK